MVIDNTERTLKIASKVIDHLSESPYFYTEIERDYSIFLYNVALVNNLFYELYDELDNTTMNLNLAIIRNLTYGDSLEVSLNKALAPITYSVLSSTQMKDRIHSIFSKSKEE